MLAFSKAEQGKRLYRFQSISLENVVRSAAQAVQYPLEEGAFNLHLDIEPGLPRVNAEEWFAGVAVVASNHQSGGID